MEDREARERHRQRLIAELRALDDELAREARPRPPEPTVPHSDAAVAIAALRDVAFEALARNDRQFDRFMALVNASARKVDAATFRATGALSGGGRAAHHQESMPGHAADGAPVSSSDEYREPVSYEQVLADTERMHYDEARNAYVPPVRR